MKIRAPLTKRQQNLLKYAHEQAADYKIIHFVFADIDGNLKLRLKKKVRNQIVFSFNNKTELAEILGLIKHFDIRNSLNLFSTKEKIAIEVT